MKKKNTLYKTSVVVSSTVFLLSILGCGGCALSKSHRFYQSKRAPIDSFVRILTTSHVRICVDVLTEGEENKTEKVCKEKKGSSSSSGAFIAHSEIAPTSHYALTAGHSCLGLLDGIPDILKPKTKVLNHSITAQMDNGRTFKARIINIDRKTDVCLLRLDNMNVFPKVLTLAEKLPARGERVYNIASPLGIFSPGMIMIYEGFYSGILNPMGWSVWSIPTKPGSSGSVIVDFRNRVVGMIFAGYRGIETMALSPPLEKMLIFFKNAYAKGEMELWQANDKNKNTTTTTTTQPEAITSLFPL
jgi:hypothetical protein